MSACLLTTGLFSQAMAANQPVQPATGKCIKENVVNIHNGISAVQINGRRSLSSMNGTRGHYVADPTDAEGG